MNQEEAIEKARDIFVYEAQGNDFPEDDWRTISEEWDLNLYTDEDDNPCATMYSVLNGVINTSVSIEIDNGKLTKEEYDELDDLYFYYYSNDYIPSPADLGRMIVLENKASEEEVRGLLENYGTSPDQEFC
jgi:hypothetical protein